MMRCRYRYGERIYFSSNTGSGIFEVDGTSLKAVLDRTGDDACDFISSQCVAAHTICTPVALLTLLLPIACAPPLSGTCALPGAQCLLASTDAVTGSCSRHLEVGGSCCRSHAR